MNAKNKNSINVRPENMLMNLEKADSVSEVSRE